jgi:hypothetical protein
VVVRPLVQRLVVAGRLVNFAFFLLTSTFCLLASSPFANEQFLKPHISTWLTNFVAFHTDFYWLALSMTALTIAPFLERSPAKIIGWAYLTASAAVGLWLATHSVMPDADAPRNALALAVVAFLPPAFLAAFDHAVSPFPAVRSIRADRRLLVSCAMAGAFCWLTFSAPVPVRLSSGGLAIGAGDWAVGSALAALAQAAAFSSIFVVFVLVSWTSRATGVAPVGEFSLLGVVAALAGVVLVTRLILAPIAIVGAGAWLFAAVASSAVVLVWSGIARHLWSGHDSDRSIVHLWCTPFAVRPALAVVLLLLLPVAAFVAVGRVSMFDWDFMFQKLIAIAVDVSAFAFLYPLLRNDGTGSFRPAPGILAAVCVVLCAGTTLGAATWLRASDASSQIGTYIAADPSLRLARDLLVRRDQSSVGFYAFLRANTGIAAPIAPVNIDLVQKIVPAPAPHIFLFIIDSLRPDYLSTYNAAVTFTPAFDAFSRDSVVFDQAFSRYGGTGLSVPSIWAAGMIPHKEYVMPFAPMNALAKLLQAYGYRRFITADHITDALFPRSADTVDLDRAVPEMRHTLCGTLTELESRLTETPERSRPIFGHTRPLDLHIGNVWSAHPDPGESYPGFHGAYASRVHRMDGCFGRFVDFLRRDGLYDDSVIIVTADHGDSLGEGLRWGHGFTVFPEVLRIPLIVHLPRGLSTEFTADVHRVSFTVDVTPTLYVLLGQRPITREPIEGSPLFVRGPGELTDRRTVPFLVASSYGPSYGVLSDNGTRLYIADGVNGREYAFDLTGSVAGRPLGITDDQRAASRHVVQEQIDAIARTYQYAVKTAEAGR